YEVSASALGRWVAAAQGTQGTGSGSHLRKADPNSQDSAELSKRVRELELENEFLKKAALDSNRQGNTALLDLQWGFVT
ncbi:transposase, partial [Corynebacterium casei]